jgi:hypothetical protein
VPQDKRITLDTTFGGIADHQLKVGDSVSLNFTRGNPQPPDGEFVIESVPDPNTFTVLTTGTGNDGDNGMFMFPLVSLPLTRSGVVSSRPSTFNMGSTDGDFNQTPLNSPTVFNFFLPDFKLPGTLASEGITTPEFQRTDENTVVRQLNFFFNGIFNPANTNGLSSFKTGGNALVMDFGPWMGNATDLGLGAGADSTKPWTDDVNLGALFDKLNTLLVAGQVPSSTKTTITNFVRQRIISSIATGNPCEVTTSTAHGLITNSVVVISGVGGGTFSPTINASFTNAIVVTSPTKFTVPVNCTVAPTAAQLVNARVAYLAYANGGTATATNRRDRIRGIVHLILTSSDYTIQR